MAEISRNSEKKKILVVAQYYYPEPFRVTDICEELVKNGYEVKVVTCFPNYPEGEIYEGYTHLAHQDEVVNGVDVHRCSVIPRKHGIFFRMLNYYSFVRQATRYIRSNDCVSKSGENFDLVFVNQTAPVLMAQPAISYSRKYHVPILMYTLDLWPEWLSGVGIGESTPPFQYYKHVSKKIYSAMDRIVVSSRAYTKRLYDRFNISQSKMEYLPQYAEDLFTPSSLRTETQQTNLLFAGNVGVMQSLDTVIRAAKILAQDNVIIHIVGDGSELEHLKALQETLDVKNVIFHGRHDVSEMPAFYEQADAMLVTLIANPSISLTLPGKVQSYMAAGKPIIAAADGETQLVIKDAKCGYFGPAEDAEELAGNIKLFINEDKAQLLGKNARDYYEKNFSKAKFMQHFMRIVDEM